MFESRSLLGIIRFHNGGDVSGAIDALVRGGIDLVGPTSPISGAELEQIVVRTAAARA